MGSRIAEEAIEGGHDVFSGYVNNEPKFGKAVRFDLRDKSRLDSIMEEVKPDVILHTAAIADVDRCELDRSLAFSINVEGTLSLAKATKRAGAFIVHISTDYVFDGIKGMYEETNIPNPVNYYGYTKLLGESCCDAVARTSVVYGSRSVGGKDNFTLQIIKRLERGEQVKTLIDQFRSPTLDVNLARMTLEIAKRRLGGIYHLSGSTRVSRFEFACKLAKLFGFDRDLILQSKMDEMKWKAKRPHDSSLSTNKSTLRLIAKPYDLDTSLRIFKKQYDSCCTD